MKYQNQNGLAIIKTVVLVTGSIILALVIFMSVMSANAKARDVRRISDIKQITDALKLYYDYNQRYPETVENQPKDITKYMQYWPQAPNADGGCTKENNQYKYQQTEGGQSYVLSFCLGKGANGYAAGYYQIKP
ncbi:MAG TPA: hypothetical protein VD998_01905 [Verrucomicrobiae bacterium]|nr:hypothetical protein [Verrucomicrobiae bacterium]